MRRVSRSVHFDIYSLRVSAYDPSAPIQSPLTCSCFSLLSVVLSLGPRTARAAARTGSSRLRRKKRCVRDPLDRGSARVCDLIDTILRRWGHGPSLYLLRRHPGPPSETKGARASGVGGGGFNDPLLAPAFSRCRVPGTLGSVGTWPRLPGLPLGAVVQLANIPLFVQPSTQSSTTYYIFSNKKDPNEKTEQTVQTSAA